MGAPPDAPASRGSGQARGPVAVQQVERLIDAGLQREEGQEVAASSGVTSLAGLLAREPVPKYGDFRAARNLLSASLTRAQRGRGPTGR